MKNLEFQCKSFLWLLWVEQLKYQNQQFYKSNFHLQEDYLILNHDESIFLNVNNPYHQKSKQKFIFIIFPTYIPLAASLTNCKRRFFGKLSDFLSNKSLILP